MKLQTFFLLTCCWLAVATSSYPAQREHAINLNPVWRFHLGEPAGEPYALEYDDSNWEIVSLPHTHELFSANLDGFRQHGRNVGWYRREVQTPPEWNGNKVFLEFQGAMQTTALWVNGKKAGEYAVSGYDSFHFDLTPHLKEGRNLLAIRVDNRVNRQIPPNGMGVRTKYLLFSPAA